MRSIAVVNAVVCLATFAASAHAQTSATIYTDGRVVIRRSFPGPIPAGRSKLMVSLPDGDPATVFALDTGLQILATRFPGAESEQTILRRAVGRSLRFLTGRGDTVTARVLSVDPLRFESPAGVMLMIPGQPLYPRDLVGARDSVELTIAAPRPLPMLQLGYHAVGITWRAIYAIRLGPSSVISGSAVLSASDIALDSSEVVLYAGQVGTTPQRRRGRALSSLDEVVVSAEPQGYPTEATPATVASHRTYLLPGRYRLQPGETTTIALFEPIAVPIERVHVIETTAQLGMTQPGSSGQPMPVQVRYRADRPRTSTFGNRALPAGGVSIYDGPIGRETLVGQAGLAHLPPNVPFELPAGVALDLRATRTASAYQNVQDSTVNPNGAISVRSVAQAQTFELTITNGADSTLNLEWHDRLPGKWRLVQSSIPGETTPTGVRFRFPVPGRGEAKVSYRVRVEP